MKPALPLTISHADMDIACGNGDAVPLSSTIAWLTRYLDSWWVVYEGGWLRITDELTAADIDNHADRIQDRTAHSPDLEEPCPPRH